MESASGSITYAERYLFGTIKSRIPIDSSLRYDGTGVAFGSDSSIVTDVYFYEKGYRVGTWITMDEKGDTLEREVYDSGRFVMRISKKGDAWDTVSSPQLPILKKAILRVREASQPVRSNYRYFD